MTPKSTAKGRKPKLVTFPDIQCHCFLLCDSITVENGKLFVLGGGLDRISPELLPWHTVIHLAIKLVVATRILQEAPVELRIEFIDTEGEGVGLPIIDGTIHMRPETNLDSEYLTFTAPFAIEIELTKAGRYAACLYVNDMPTAQTQFEVVAPSLSETPDEE